MAVPPIFNPPKSTSVRGLSMLGMFFNECPSYRDFMREADDLRTKELDYFERYELPLLPVKRWTGSYNGSYLLLGIKGFGPRIAAYLGFGWGCTELPAIIK